MTKEMPFDIKYVDLHAVHGTTSVLCSLVLNNGRVVVGEAHSESNSTENVVLARKHAENRRVIVQAFAEQGHKHG